jgi:hypothetical protein
MKIRILSIVCVTTAATLLAACSAVYRNPDACVQLMRSKLTETSPDTLKVTHTSTAIGGSRVVVEGSIEHVTTASEVAAAAAASAAPRAASGSKAASGAAASVAASATEATSLTSAKPKKTTTAAAAECTFNGSVLGTFSWLAPARLAKPADETGETTE